MNRVVFPNAKINLGLKVLNKMHDGFHNLETIFLPVHTVTDILEISDNTIFSKEESENINKIGKVYFKQTGINAGDLSDNLCVKAYQLIDEELGGALPPVFIHLHKQIPIGAGLGGGSSDAVFTLVTINSLFNAGLSKDRLLELSSKMGSDCPFFIYNRPMLGRGRGEKLTPCNFTLPDGYYLDLVFPPVFVSTVDAYKGIVPRDKQDSVFPDNASLTDLIKLPLTEWKQFIFNDFEKTVFSKYPQLMQYKQNLYDRGAVYASMSGSGSSMFGIFKR